VALCPEPLVAVMEAGGPAVLVSAKVAVPGTPATDAMTLYDPAVAFAVSMADIAMPDAFVTAVFAPPTKVADGPLDGAVNVTVTPLTALPAPSRTVAVRRFANAVLMAADCGVPPVAMMEAAPPAVFVSVNVAGV
jgi:hypothetical protein